ncbi:MAG: YraN family protein [Clostridiales bacterium]|nr:YraN family protein [Clostridiales bacterium]
MIKIFKKQPQHLKIGQRGERAARRYLRRHGYRILSKNYTYGKCELDIVAEHRKTGILVFAEVKTRTKGQLTLPREAVNFQKRENIRKAARQYVRAHKFFDKCIRYDILEVIAPEFAVTHIENAFNGEKR